MMKAIKLALAFGALSVSTWAMANDELGVPLSVRLEAAGDLRGQSDSLRWSMTNRGEETVLVLRWETPVDGLSTSLFAVEHEGVQVPYMDKIVHWAHPTVKDFIAIAPGETLSAVVDIGASYAMVDAGEYTVRFDGELTYMLASDSRKGAAELEDLGAVSLDADSIVLRSGGRDASYYASLGALRAPAIELTRAVSYANCSSSQSSQLPAAHSQAQSYAGNANSYFNAGTVSARFTTWFGAYTSSRYATAKDHFNKINNVLQNLNTTYDCYCTPSSASAFAYVYPSQPYIIHLCNAFWAANVSGTDSRGGTIIHEQSHFTLNGGTQDYAYGHTNAKRLATSQPKKAVMNADNHEYFAENTPAQN